VVFKKEAEMKAIKLAGMLALAIAAVAMAQHGTVNWTVVDSGAGGPYTAGDVVSWGAYVDLTTEGNKGLGVYVFDINIVNSSDALIANTPTSDFAKSFNALGKAGTNARKAVQDSSIGGLSMNGAYSTGALSPGKVEGAGTGFGSPWKAKSLSSSGIMFTGVGHADRKVTYASNNAKGLLANGVSEFVMNNGTIPTTGLAPGLYTVKLIPDANAHNVLAVTNTAGPIDYTTNFEASFQISASAVHGSSFVFEIVPEPTTLLLVAGGIGAFIRRRRA
jgi:hypothetical protein